MTLPIFMCLAAAHLSPMMSASLAGLGVQDAPANSVPEGEPDEKAAATWKVRGDRSVRPARISDDGLRTYLEFEPEQSLPAVFAVGPTGDEQVVDGYMRDGVFVIDRVHLKLVFRIDNDRATALREEPAR